MDANSDPNSKTNSNPNSKTNSDPIASPTTVPIATTRWVARILLALDAELLPTEDGTSNHFIRLPESTVASWPDSIRRRLWNETDDPTHSDPTPAERNASFGNVTSSAPQRSTLQPTLSADPAPNHTAPNHTAPDGLSSDGVSSSSELRSLETLLLWRHDTDTDLWTHAKAERLHHPQSRQQILDAASEHPPQSCTTAEWVEALTELLRVQPLAAILAIQLDTPELTSAAIMEQIKGCYSGRDVQIHVAGCHFESRPWLAMLRQTPDRNSPIAAEFFDFAGQALPRSRVEALALDRWAPESHSILPHEASSFQEWLTRLPENAITTTESPGTPDRQALGSAVIWCRWACGRVTFETDQNERSIEFAGWASDFLSGELLPPGLECPESHEKGREIVVLPDGTITNSHAVENCAVSHEPTIRTRLTKCPVSGQIVFPKFLVACAVSGRRMLASAFSECRTCRRPTDPSAMSNGICLACEQLEHRATEVPAALRDAIVGRLPASVTAGCQWRMGAHGNRQVILGKRWYPKIRVVVEHDQIVEASIRTSPFGKWKRNEQA